jgi:hypothetical protein
MKQRKFLLPIILLFIFLLLLSCTGDDITHRINEDIDSFITVAMGREDIDFEQLPFFLPEIDEMKNIFQSFIIEMNKAESPQEQIELIKEFDLQNRSYVEMSRIAYIRFSQNISDEAETDIKHFNELFTKTSYYENSAYAAIINSRYIEQLKEYFGTESIERLRKSVNEYSPRQAELMQQIRGFENEYTRLFNETMMQIVHDDETFAFMELFMLMEKEQDIREQRRILEVLVASQRHLNSLKSQKLTLHGDMEYFRK